MTLDLLSKIWPLILSVIGLIVWLVRIEARIKSSHDICEERTATQSKRNDEINQDIDDLRELTSKLGVVIAEIRGFLSRDR